MVDDDKQTEQLVVLDSSFNPPTIAHAEMLRQGMACVPQAVGMLLFSTRNMDKPLEGASLEQRIAMMELEAQRVMVGVTDKGLFFDKLDEVRLKYPLVKQVFFVVGMDTLERVWDQKYYTDPIELLMDAFHAKGGRWLCMARTGSAHVQLGNVRMLPQLDQQVSSTNARRAAAKGNKAMLLSQCSPAIAEYILANGLYRN